MTTLVIIGMWIVAIAGMYLFTGITFWAFAQLFGLIDNYLQDRYWASKGYERMTDNKGETWYVGYGE